MPVFTIFLTENVTVDRCFLSNIVNISRKRAIIRNIGAYFREENIEKFGFFLKIVYETIFVKQQRHNKYFLVILKKM